LFDAIRSGARGYLLKNIPIVKLLASLRAVERGEAAISRRMTGRLAEEFYRLSMLHVPEQTVR
jgi:DNA-binding NarL/FixJ family response regulator